MIWPNEIGTVEYNCLYLIGNVTSLIFNYLKLELLQSNAKMYWCRCTNLHILSGKNRDGWNAAYPTYELQTKWCGMQNSNIERTSKINRHQNVVISTNDEKKLNLNVQHVVKVISFSFFKMSLWIKSSHDHQVKCTLFDNLIKPLLAKHVFGRNRNITLYNW